MIEKSALIRMYRKPMGLRIFTLLMMLFVLAFGSNLHAQDIQITGVDSSAFPEIKIQFTYTGKKKFEQGELTLMQDGKNLNFSVAESAPGSAPEKGRAVYFLLETSGNTFGNALIEMREGLFSALDNLDPEDLLNAGTFGSFEVDSSGLQLMSDHFTASHSRIREALTTRMKAYEDTARKSDLYKNIIASLGYIQKETSLPQHKLLIVLTAARNNSSSPETSSGVIGKARDMGMPIHSITILASDSAYSAGRMDLISRKTGGKYYTCKTQIEIANAITDMLNLPVPESMRDANYTITLTAFNELKLNSAKIDLSYKGARQIITASAPTGEGLISEDYRKYLWISIGIFGLIVVFMILINVFSRRKMRRESEPADLTAPEQLTEDHSVTETKPVQQVIRVQAPKNLPKVDPEPLKIPEVPKSAGPIVLVSLNGRIQTYPLVKEETFIGRHDTNDIQIPEITVTGKHAVFKYKDGKVFLEDLGSTNGTFVNGERIRSKEILHGNRIRVGQIEITLKFSE